MNLKQFYALQALTKSLAFGFFGATYSVFLVKNGVSPENIVWVNFVYMIVAGLLDPVTGFIGDKYGHVKTHFVGVFILFLSTVFYAISSNFTMFLVAETGAAIAVALISNALDAYVINQWKKENPEDAISKYSKLRKKVKTWSLVLSGGATLAGSYAVQISNNWSIPWYMSAVTILLSLVVGLYMYNNLPKENPDDYDADELALLPKLSFFSAISKVSKEKELMTLATVAFLFVASVQALNMYWSIYLVDLGAFALGLTMLGVRFSLIFGVWIGDFLGTHKRVFGIAFVVTSLPIFAIYFSESLLLAAILFVLHEVGRGMFDQVNKVKTEELIKDDSLRSTFASFVSGVEYFGAATGLFLSWFLLGVLELSIPELWLISVLILLLLVPFVLIRLKR